MTENLPSAPTVAVPRGEPSAALTVTMEPTSPEPERLVPSGLTVRSVGAAAGVVSGAVAGADGLVPLELAAVTPTVCASF